MRLCLKSTTATFWGNTGTSVRPAPCDLNIVQCTSLKYILQSMEVSVIVPVHNGLPFVEDCMNSIFKQDFKGNFEVVVYNDRSNVVNAPHPSDVRWTALLKPLRVGETGSAAAAFASLSLALMHRLALGVESASRGLMIQQLKSEVPAGIVPWPHPLEHISAFKMLMTSCFLRASDGNAILPKR
jgi:hypothetical protein